VFIFVIIIAILALLAIGFGILAKNIIAGVGGGIGLVVAVILLFVASFYTQDPGEANVLRDWTGNLVGQELNSGGHWKAPWVDTVTFDIRNQIAAYIGDGKDDYNGSKPEGPQITFQDKDGVTGNMDLVVVYSVQPDSVQTIYKDYLNQENFQSRLIEQDIRSVPRNVAAEFGTLDLLNDRATVANKIQESLAERWKDEGVIVESVSLQEIRYSKSVTTRFDQAQQARIDVQTSQANLDKAKVDAQQQVVQAQAQADANAILTQSLTPQVLEQHWIDAVGKAGTIIVPNNFTALGNLAAK
jgi:regulator of protease activity HflC (stomatin/prohibitin superfamily)